MAQCIREDGSSISLVRFSENIMFEQMAQLNHGMNLRQNTN